MRAHGSRLRSPRLIGGGTLSLALLTLGALCAAGGPGAGHSRNPLAIALAAGLVAVVIPAHRFPIHIQHKAKLYVCTIALYLMAVLLPLPLAMAATGLGIAGGQLLVKSQRGLKLHHIATETGRWMLLGLLGAAIAHLRVPIDDGLLREMPLLGAALTLLAGDILSCPLLIAPLSGKPPKRIILAVAREAGPAEAAQYFVGMLGALVVNQQVWALILLAVPTVLVYRTFKKEMDTDTFKLLEGMADAVDLRDRHTGGHSRRVAELVASVLKEMRMNGPESRLIRTAARLHDIGKIGIPDRALKKEGLLTPEERALMRRYPDHGAELLSRYPDFSRGVDMVRYHHERWDGQGYPRGLAGTDIPFGARVIAVADSYDAMTTDRPYRKALPPERAAGILLEGRGKQWDPEVVDAFLRSITPRLRHPIVLPGLRVVGETIDQLPGVVNAWPTSGPAAR